MMMMAVAVVVVVMVVILWVIITSPLSGLVLVNTLALGWTE